MLKRYSAFFTLLIATSAALLVVGLTLAKTGAVSTMTKAGLLSAQVAITGLVASVSYYTIAPALDSRRSSKSMANNETDEVKLNFEPDLMLS